MTPRSVATDSGWATPFRTERNSPVSSTKRNDQKSASTSSAGKVIFIETGRPRRDCSDGGVENENYPRFVHKARCRPACSRLGTRASWAHRTVKGTRRTDLIK